MITIPEDIDIDIDIEGEGAIIDLTNPKVFAIAAILSVIFGFMIGLGFYMIFEQFPNVPIHHRFEILLILVLTGVGIGYIPHVMYAFYKGRNLSEDPEDEDELL